MRPTRAAQLVFFLLIMTLVLLPGASATAKAGPTPGFPVQLVCGNVYWESYSDYTQGLLSVDYGIGNIGASEIYNVTLSAATAANAGPNQVTSSTIIPMWMGDMSPDQWNTRTIKWLVPEGVQRFRTTLSICSTCDGTICVDGDNGGIDIKPGSCPNSVNLNKGDVAVAAFSYGSFDARTIDPSTVIFAGASPTRWDTEDKNGDGKPDVVFHFNRPDTNLQGSDSRACLNGNLTTGGAFRACDMVRIIDN